LKGNRALYSFSAGVYHSCQNAASHAALLGRGVKYLKPLAPHGRYTSQFGQDYYLETLGLLEPGGFFVEVGCNDPKFNSNSYFLEHEYGYTGVSIDAIDYSEAFRTLRPNTRFIRALVDEKPGMKDFYQVVDVDGWENQVSSVYKETLQMGKGFQANVVQVECAPLKSLLNGRREVDVMLVDVEGHEFAVLESLDWDDMKPKVILVENSGEFYPRWKLENYMAVKGYEFLARIGSSDDIYRLPA
jgi:hypothetical protein